MFFKGVAGLVNKGLKHRFREKMTVEKGGIDFYKGRD
jgi:hypothetical protein